MSPDFLPDFNKGQNVYASALRMLVLKEDERLFSFLDFNNDHAFLEPHLFLYYNQKKKGGIPLGQVLFSYVQKK